ncbi:flavodoxin family protein [Peribacillus simplex]
MKKKVFVYIGSRNPESRLYQNTYEILENFKKRAEGKIELTIELYSPLNSHINPSTGCKDCFNHGKCPSELTAEDAGAEIKQKMSEADIVILASPVYAHNVSSDMKVLVDRLSYWSHLYKLAKKVGIVITTAESNGSHFVSEYLDKTLTFMGASVSYKANFINSENFLREAYIEETVDALLNACDENYEFKPTNQQETTFNTLKMVLTGYAKDHFEYRYWDENRLFECDTLEEYFRKYA